MATSTALWWLSQEDKDHVAWLRLLWEWQPGFAFEVQVAQTKMLKDGAGFEAVYTSERRQMAHSCLFHEHLVHDEDACRKRVNANTYIFAGIVDACIKDGVAMAKEMDEKVEDDVLPIASVPAAHLD
jgi:hypothetical protein